MRDVGWPLHTPRSRAGLDVRVVLIQVPINTPQTITGTQARMHTRTDARTHIDVHWNALAQATITGSGTSFWPIHVYPCLVLKGQCANSFVILFNILFMNGILALEHPCTHVATAMKPLLFCCPPISI